MIEVSNDKLLGKVRYQLRKDYGYPQGTDNGKGMKKFNIDAIYSTQNPVYPQCDGTVSTKIPQNDADVIEGETIKSGIRLNCASGFGSVTHMTATVGMFAAARALDIICKHRKNCK